MEWHLIFMYTSSNVLASNACRLNAQCKVRPSERRASRVCCIRCPVRPFVDCEAFAHTSWRRSHLTGYATITKSPNTQTTRIHRVHFKTLHSDFSHFFCSNEWCEPTVNLTRLTYASDTDHFCFYSHVLLRFKCQSLHRLLIWRMSTFRTIPYTLHTTSDCHQWNAIDRRHCHRKEANKIVEEKWKDRMEKPKTFECELQWMHKMHGEFKYKSIWILLWSFPSPAHAAAAAAPATIECYSTNNDASYGWLQLASKRFPIGGHQVASLTGKYALCILPRDEDRTNCKRKKKRGKSITNANANRSKVHSPLFAFRWIASLVKNAKMWQIFQSTSWSWSHLNLKWAKMNGFAGRINAGHSELWWRGNQKFSIEKPWHNTNRRIEFSKSTRKLYLFIVFWLSCAPQWHAHAHITDLPEKRIVRRFAELQTDTNRRLLTNGSLQSCTKRATVDWLNERV